MTDKEPLVKINMGKSDLKTIDIGREMYIHEIISCQSAIDSLCEKQSEEKRKTSQLFEVLKKPHIDRRTELIRLIPNFWVNTIESHPQLCLLLDDEVIKVLRYMTQIETEEDKNAVSFKIHFLFEENPYIENDVLTKEVSLFREEAEIRSFSTAITWKSNQKVALKDEVNSLTCYGDSSKKKNKNFFVWFCDNENPEDDIFMYFQAVCQNPLPYSPFFFDNSDEDIEESRNTTGAGDLKSRVLLKEMDGLNLNEDKDGKMNMD